MVHEVNSQNFSTEQSDEPHRFLKWEPNGATQKMKRVFLTMANLLTSRNWRGRS